MGGLGTSTSQSTQQQQSQTSPWAPAQPLLGGILGQLQKALPNTGATVPEQSALNTIQMNGNNAAGLAPAIQGVTTSLLNGGGALNQTGNVQNAFNQYQANTSGLANNTNYNPYSTPGFGDALGTMNNDITNQINGSFAAAGRDFSGANQQALARGLSQGEGQLIQNQYQNNINNQQNAARNLYSAGNTNAGILSGLQQQYLANQQAGVNGVPTALNASNAGANAILGASQMLNQGIPLGNLGMISNIGIPIAGLGNQTQGTSQTQGSSTASPLSTISGLLGIFGEL